LAMSAITFDTHKFIRRLKDSGLPEAQAEAIADAFREAQGEAELATKQDIVGVKQDIALLKRDIQEMELRLTIKLGAMLVVAIGAVATLVKLL